MAGDINAVYTMKVIGPDGTIVYTGGVKMLHTFEAVNAEASTTALGAEAIISHTSSVINAPSASVGDEEIYFSRIVNASSVGVIGVTCDPILAGKKGMCAGIGAFVPVRTNGTAAKDVLLVTSSTAGQVTSTGSKSATVPAIGTVLGLCFKANASIGSVNIAGVLVSPQ